MDCTHLGVKLEIGKALALGRVVEIADQSISGIKQADPGLYSVMCKEGPEASSFRLTTADGDCTILGRANDVHRLLQVETLRVCV